MSGDTIIELKPVVIADALLILESWGRRPENFTYLTAKVFAGLSDARCLLADGWTIRDGSA